MMTRCSSCPAPPDATCLAHATGHARFCDWAAKGGIHRAHVRANSHVGTPVVEQQPRAVSSRRSASRHTGDVLLSAYLSSWQGYGQHAEWLARGLEGFGHHVGLIDLGTDTRWIGRDSWVEYRLVDPDTVAPWSIVLAVPFHPTPAGRVVRYTMWETTRISEASVAELNKAAIIIVPCQHNREAFRSSGVTVPIEVVPSGIDPAVYHDDGTPLPLNRVVFGMAARMAHGGARKGVNEGMKAFIAAFDRSVTDVELRVKVFEDCLSSLRVPDDPRIKISTQAMRPQEMAGWYRGISCLFVPSKGEGWGFHTLQAMACGRPVIAVPWSGTVEFWDESCGWPIDYDLALAGEFYAMPGAEWAVPRHESMVEILRHIHTHPEEVRTKGKFAARRATEFSWERTNRELKAILERHGFLTRPAPPFDSKLIAAIESCDFRRSPCSCISKPSRCLQGGYPAVVSFENCRSCVNSQSL